MSVKFAVVQLVCECGGTYKTRQRDNSARHRACGRSRHVPYGQEWEGPRPPGLVDPGIWLECPHCFLLWESRTRPGQYLKCPRCGKSKRVNQKTRGFDSRIILDWDNDEYAREIKQSSGRRGEKRKRKIKDDPTALDRPQVSPPFKHVHSYKDREYVTHEHTDGHTPHTHTDFHKADRWEWQLPRPRSTKANPKPDWRVTEREDREAERVEAEIEDREHEEKVERFNATLTNTVSQLARMFGAPDYADQLDQTVASTRENAPAPASSSTRSTNQPRSTRPKRSTRPAKPLPPPSRQALSVNVPWAGRLHIVGKALRAIGVPLDPSAGQYRGWCMAWDSKSRGPCKARSTHIVNWAGEYETHPQVELCGMHAHNTHRAIKGCDDSELQRATWSEAR